MAVVCVRTRLGGSGERGAETDVFAAHSPPPPRIFYPHGGAWTLVVWPGLPRVHLQVAGAADGKCFRNHDAATRSHACVGCGVACATRWEDFRTFSGVTEEVD